MLFNSFAFFGAWCFIWTFSAFMTRDRHLFFKRLPENISQTQTLSDFIMKHANTMSQNSETLYK